MTKELEKHYKDLLDRHGDNPQAVQHADHASQQRRFRVLSEISPDLGSIVDLGCGLGHFCDFIHDRRGRSEYLGLDALGDFIERANARHTEDARTNFKLFDLRESEYPSGYDTFIICGVFNNQMSDNKHFMYEVLEKAFSAASKQVAFNAMSTYVDFEAPDLYYTDPREVFDFCKKHLTRRVSLRHDYLVREDRPPYEYTMYLYK